MSDRVDHPSYYQLGDLEAIDIIDAIVSDLRGQDAFDTGCCLKYLCRWSKKGGLEDLEKARWYLDHLIEHIQEDNP